MTTLNYLGTIMLFNGSTPPDGWSFCDGTKIQRGTNNALFAIIGHQYTFENLATYYCLPKLANVGNMHYIICTSGHLPCSA